MNNKILVTGATGGLGSKVVELLKLKIPSKNLVVLVRDETSELAKQDKTEGIEVKSGNYADVESLENAFTGIDTVYFVSAGEDSQRSLLHRNVIDMARKASVGQIVYTSGVWKNESESSALAALVDSHLQTENHLKNSGITYTILRHNLYAEVIEMLIGNKNRLLKTKTIYLPTANGLSSFVPKNDLAEAGVNVLLNASIYANKILEFNGE